MGSSPTKCGVSRLQFILRSLTLKILLEALTYVEFFSIVI